MQFADYYGLVTRRMVFALACAPSVCMAKRVLGDSGADVTYATRQIERLAAREVRVEFVRRGVTDWGTVGFDPDVDAGLKSLHGKREPAHVQDLLTGLGGQLFSSDSITNSSNCRSSRLTWLV
ncbi:MAG: hypothetical protein M3R65_00515 [Gemmatimonadota bacterium]|nr:hypothetical protein [Gemmatimonadota bacterium]